MCLDRLQKFNVKLDKDGVGEGWKVFGFESNEGKLLGDYCNTGKIRPKNKWLKEKEFRKPESIEKCCCWISGGSYTVGWHIFKTLKGARRWRPTGVVKKVKFRTIVATGRQTRFQVIVAKEIFIPNEQ